MSRAIAHRRPRCGAAAVAVALLAALATPALAAPGAVAPLDGLNPISLVEEASALLPGSDGRLSSAISILVLFTALSLAPTIVILCTCFTRMLVAFAMLRQAMGTNSVPPASVVTGLSLLLTIVVMAPTFERAYADGIRPYTTGEIDDYGEAWDRAKQPLRDFMFAQIESTGNWSSLYLMLNYRGVDTSDPSSLKREDVDMLSLVPAFVLSELKTAFLIGFRIYLPFLVIDMVIASMLISMGMLMLPPVLISMPFKVLLFVLVDGWQLVAGSLMAGVVQPGSS